MDTNKVIITGNLVDDPNTRFTPTGKHVTNFRIGSNRSWTSDNGEKKTAATFVNCVAWNGTGDAVAKYMKKGSKVLVEGRLEIRPLPDKDGARGGFWTEIVADHVQFLSKGEAQPEIVAQEEIPF